MHDTDAASIAYQDGRWLTLDSVSISPLDMGFRQAVTAVERLRTYDSHIWQLQPHLNRFSHTCRGLGIAMDRDRWAAIISELIDRNESANRRSCEHVSIVLLATPGIGTGHNNCTQIAHLAPIDVRRCETRRQFGQSLVITNVQQPSPASWPRDWKVRCRLQYYLADQFASSIDHDACGLLIDHDGSVTESGIANIAIEQSAQIISPPPDQVLPGISRSVTQKIAGEMGFQWLHQRLHVQDICDADAVWMMGTDTGLWFANRVWHQDRWHPKQATPLTAAMLQHWSQATR